MIKVILYYILGASYIILMVEFFKEPLKKLLIGFPESLLDIILFLPCVFLFSLSYESYKKIQLTKSNKQVDRVDSFSLLWRGDLSMPQSFWAYHFLGVAFILFFGGFALFTLSKYSSLKDIILVSILLISCGCCLILTTVGTWRSSTRFTTSLKWVLITRLSLIITLIITFIHFVLIVMNVEFIKPIYNYLYTFK